MSQRRCLVVDDDRITATFLAELVAAQGFIVEIARTTIEADRVLPQQPYDILLVDRRLPDGDGVRWLTRVLASGDPARSPRALVISGDLLSAADLPTGVACMRKPIDPDYLCRWLADQRDADGLEAPQLDAGVAMKPLDLLDDARALARFGGNHDALRALRTMLLAELDDSAQWRLNLRDPTPPPAAIDALHRLRAACALTGCARLGQVSEAIEGMLRRGLPVSAYALDDLDSVVAATRAAIAKQVTMPAGLPDSRPIVT